MLAQIDNVTKNLQSQYLSLSDCRLALDTIMESVRNEKNNCDSDLYQCKPGNQYISSNALLSTKPLKVVL